MGEMPQPGSPAPLPRLAPVGLAVCVLVGGLITVQAGALALLGWRGAGLPPALATLPGLLWTAGMAAGWIGLVALVGGLLSGEPLLRRLGLVRPVRLSAVDWTIAVVGALATSQAADLALRLSGAGRGAPLEFMLSILAGARGAGLVAAVLIVGVGAGFAEEAFFRGFVQRRLVDRFGPTAGVLGAAALFALVHFDPQHSAFAFVFGIFVGAIALWTGSTWPAIGLHAVNNATSVLLVAGGLDRAEAALPSSSPGLALALLAFVVVAASSARRIRRRAAALRVDPAPPGPVGFGA